MIGIILAGGKSSRFGREKAFLNIEGRPIIEVLVSKLSSVFEEVFIVTNNKKKFGYLNTNIIPDIFPDKGPLGGIHAGLVHSKSPYSFFTACDMPFLNTDVVRNMINEVEGYDIVVPGVKDRLHPLCAIYSKRCIPVIEDNLKKGNLRVQSIFNELKTKIIDKMFTEGRHFININTKEDYEQISR